MSKYFIAILFIALIIGAGTIMELSIQEASHGATLVQTADEAQLELPEEKGMFSDPNRGLSFQNTEYDDAKGRSLKTYYNNRAYNGAPPIIPHPLLSTEGIGGKSCLQCHQNGGFVKQFNAYAPITPHPEFTSCKQCHVPQATTQLFKGTNWEKTKLPEIHQSALSGSPPVIPHGLQLRQNCLSCHAGPAAPKEIRVSHPERINCRQCHVPSNQNPAPFWLKSQKEKKKD